MLGVCLGHQAIGVAYGATGRPRTGSGARQGRCRCTTAARACSAASTIHSWPLAITRWWSRRPDLPDVLEATAWSDDGLIMAMRHRDVSRRGRAVSPRVRSARRRDMRCCATSSRPRASRPARVHRVSEPGRHARRHRAAQACRGRTASLRRGGALGESGVAAARARHRDRAARRHDHRGDEAPLAERRRAPPRRSIRSPSHATTPHAASPRSPCSPTGPTSAARSTTSPPCARRVDFPCCARTSRSTPCRSPRRAWPVRTGCC